MTDYPIIFSGPMVRALLEGRKTQTRRLAWRGKDTDDSFRIPTVWQNGKAGDRLYVRENFQILSFGDYVPTKSYPADVRFAATDPLADCDKDVRGYSWRPSIHMPRWASRLTLVVTEVRFQRLQDITEVEAQAEGIPPVPPPPGYEDEPCGWQSFQIYPDGSPHPHAAAPNSEAYQSFAQLWDSLHGHGSWAASPEIVALTFSVHHVNIDRLGKEAA